MISTKAVFALAKALEGLPVLGTLDRTPAARAGVRWGDILLEVNGRRTRTVNDYVDAKSRREDGMSIVVFRDGATIAIEIVFDRSSSKVDADTATTALERMGLAPRRGGGGDDDPFS